MAVRVNVFIELHLYRQMNDLENELEQLYRSDYSRFEAVLTALAGDRERARDAVQQAFAIALARKRQFRGEGSLAGWVWKIALREATRQIRRPPSTATDAEAPAVMPLVDADLARHLLTLPPRRKLFVFLRYVADLSYDEIADACDVSRGTVAATLAQARADLEPSLLDNPTVGGARA